ncbi:unnamed protein product [Mycena citricolor]|uniref:CCHC-type domain-containing protein n=1 Tax=Mycena citricolor TaxID=2018698 RepID=A0AAD2H2B7_9AGAR|nr:unnamed protein product [Mycena citricolor]
MSPEVLRLISDRYASLAIAAERKTPVFKRESDIDSTPESDTGSDATGEMSRRSNTEVDPPGGISGNESDHAYPLEAAEWSEDVGEPSPPVAGPSQEKGKGPDPGNWGEIGLSDAELEEQKAALQTFEVAKRGQSSRTPDRNDAGAISMAGHRPPDGALLLADRDVFLREFARMRDRIAELEDRDRNRGTSSLSEARELKPRKTEPMTSPGKRKTLSPKPSVEKGRSKSTKGSAGFVTSVLRGVSLQPSDDGDSSSSSSDSDSDSDGGGPPSDSSSDSGSDTDSSSSGSKSSTDRSSSTSGSSAGRGRARGHKGKSRKSKARSKGRMLVKPNAPARYDGSENADLYTQFVDESNRYCELGNVPRAHRVAIIGSFLDGDAKDFYNRRVRGHEHKWTLKKMLRRLLKYCFSLDYRQKQRKRLARCYQNGKSVNKHVLELESILLQIGLKKDRERVALLWNSFDADIQEELFRFGLDPEKSKWTHVVKKAVRAERFLSLDKRRKPKGGTNSAAGTSAAASGNDSREGKKKRFFSRRQNGVIKASAAAVIPPRGNATRPASRPTTCPGSTTAHPRAHENQVDRPWERRLSPQKRAELMARGVCLNCEEAGHMARSCPKLTTMRSKVKGKPPGFGAHGVSLRLASLGETTEVLDTLEVSSAFPVGFREDRATLERWSWLDGSEEDAESWDDSEDLDDDELNYTAWGLVENPDVEELADGIRSMTLDPYPADCTSPRRPELGLIDRAVELTESTGLGSTGVGDLAARFASLVLQRCAPFPGDDGSEPTEGRFLVYRVLGGDYYCILDCGTPLDILEGDELVRSADLQDPNFELGWHWAQKCYLAQGGSLKVPRSAAGALLRYSCGTPNTPHD